MPIFKETPEQRFLSKEDAKAVLERVVLLRNSSAYPFNGNSEQTFRQHSFLVATIAETIAKKAAMDSLKAYVFGLLHDSGRYRDERAEKLCHALEGYNYLMEQNLPECARISITHGFYQKDFDKDVYIYSAEQQRQCRNFLSEIEFNDYDRLIQLSDVLNNMGETCSIDYRFASISQRYNVPVSKFKPTIDLLKRTKGYFDNKCNCNIYDLFNIKE